MVRLLSILCLIQLFAFAALGAPRTFYIDHDGGADGNNGTTTGTAWQHHPYMTGWAGTYTHQNGDRFIFKGGVTWPNASAVMMSIATGGTAGNVDYYGVDATWYTGGSWSRPIFDGTHATRRIIDGSDYSYITFDSLELKGVHATQNSADMSINMDNVATYITITNCYIHDWTHAAISDGQFGGIRHYLGSTPTGVKVTHCDIGNPEHGGDSGTCIYYVDEVDSCTIHDCPNGILHGGRLVHDSEFYAINSSYDGAQHPNVMFLDNPVGGGPAYIYNNYLHGSMDAEIIYLVGDGRATAANYVYNNVVMPSVQGAPPLIVVDIDSGHTTAMSTYIYNNTLVAAGGGAIQFVSRGSGSYALCDAYNNHWINAGTPDYSANTSWASGSELIQTTAQANSAGYNSGNFWSPQSAGAPTVLAGTNLTAKGFAAFTKDTTRGGLRTALDRPASGFWDIGAYKYSGTPSGVTINVTTLRVGTLRSSP